MSDTFNNKHMDWATEKAEQQRQAEVAKSLELAQIDAVEVFNSDPAFAIGTEHAVAAFGIDIEVVITSKARWEDGTALVDAERLPHRTPLQVLIGVRGRQVRFIGTRSKA